MNKTIFAALSGVVLYCSAIANAAVISTVTFTTPTAVVSATDNVEVWVTLTLAGNSEPLAFDGSTLESLPGSLLPAKGSLFGSGPDIYSFVSYQPFTGRSVTFNCSGNFFKACDDGEYHRDAVFFGSDAWLGSNAINLQPGESQNFLIYNLAPTDGSAQPGSYALYNISIGFLFRGLDINGREIQKTVYLGSTCPSQNSTCSFTRTVESVPLPGAAWMFGSGLIGFTAIGRNKRRFFDKHPLSRS